MNDLTAVDKLFFCVGDGSVERTSVIELTARVNKKKSNLFIFFNFSPDIKRRDLFYLCSSTHFENKIVINTKKNIILPRYKRLSASVKKKINVFNRKKKRVVCAFRICWEAHIVARPLRIKCQIVSAASSDIVGYMALMINLR